MSCNHITRENKEYYQYEFKVDEDRSSSWRINKNIVCPRCKNIVCNDCFLNIFRINDGCFVCPHCCRIFDYRNKYRGVEERIKSILTISFSS